MATNSRLAQPHGKTSKRNQFRDRALILGRLSVLGQRAEGYDRRLRQYKAQMQWWWRRGQGGSGPGACLTGMALHMLGQVIRPHEAPCAHTAAELLLSGVSAFMAR